MRGLDSQINILGSPDFDCDPNPLSHVPTERLLSRQDGAGGTRFDLIDEEMIEIHKKFRAFASFLQNETGFMNALTVDILWKSIYVKYE
jgi:hypothetical protein